MSIDSVPAFLLLCDKVLESQANELASTLRTGTGSIILKTLEDVLEKREGTFSKNLDNNLRKYARAVIVICSENFTKYIDNKDRSNCPKVLKENEDCHKVLKDFFLSERQKVVTKLILVSLNGSESVPAELNGMEIIKKDIETFGVYETFSGQIKAEVMSRITRTPQEEMPLVVVKYNPNKSEEYPPELEKLLKNPYDEDWRSSTFWNEVRELHGDGKTIKWADALDTVRLKYIRKKYESENKDYLVAIITEVYKKFRDHVQDQHMVASFKSQLSKFVRKGLKADFDSTSDAKDRRYSKVLPIPDEGEKTILHLAAERDLVDIAKSYIKLYPNHVYEVTSGHGLRRIPLEFAIRNGHDETASYLATKMMKSRVRGLFEPDPSGTYDARLKFADVIINPNMKKTVVALLDCCINPDWPFIPVESGEEKEEAWARQRDNPLNYHIYYRMLDSDSSGEAPKINEELNDMFNPHLPSCLQLLVDGTHSKNVILHPIVRYLANKKWDAFGWKHMFCRFIMYMVFLLMMSLSFFIDNNKESLNHYNTKFDYFRAFCEIVTLLIAFAHLLSEFDQMEKDRRKYLFDPYNYLDLFGLTLIFILVPLRFAGDSKQEWSVASVAYLFNFLRVFKYFPANKQIGIYSKTFAQIIYSDITKFAVVYLVVMVAFTGSVFLAIRASMTESADSLGFFNIMLREVRALAESNPFEDSYDTFNTWVIILIMLNMFTIIVILSNILIGQLSYRYETARDQGEKQYSIDKVRYITKIEKSGIRKKGYKIGKLACWLSTIFLDAGFDFFQNTRIEYYMEGDYVSEEVFKELVVDWVKEQQAKQEDLREALRYMMNNYSKTSED